MSVNMPLFLSHAYSMSVFCNLMYASKKQQINFLRLNKDREKIQGEVISILRHISNIKKGDICC